MSGADRPRRWPAPPAPAYEPRDPGENLGTDRNAGACRPGAAPLNRPAVLEPYQGPPRRTVAGPSDGALRGVPRSASKLRFAAPKMLRHAGEVQPTVGSTRTHAVGCKRPVPTPPASFVGCSGKQAARRGLAAQDFETRCGARDERVRLAGWAAFGAAMSGAYSWRGVFGAGLDKAWDTLAADRVFAERVAAGQMGAALAGVAGVLGAAGGAR